MKEAFHNFISKASQQMSSFDEDRFRQAYDFAANVYNGEKGISGKPYIQHAFNLVEELMSYQLDDDTLIAAFLHDVFFLDSVKYTEIERKFGKNVADFVHDMWKLDFIKGKAINRESEIFRRMFFAMAKDLRVVRIKLIDKLLHVRLIDNISRSRQDAFAREVLEIFAPVAGRLGMYGIKGEIEDIAFRILYPKEFSNIQEQIQRQGSEREEWITHARDVLQRFFTKERIDVEVTGRLKGYYSIFRKLKRKNTSSIDEIYDIFAMRLVFPDQYREGKECTGHLYEALGVVHNNFVPLSRRFKDYIAMPKMNGYRSLHTAVLGLGGGLYDQPTEIQIRSQSMHKAAEQGIASHWCYKSSASVEKLSEWISGLSELQEEMQNHNEFIRGLKVDIFQDRIFVLTPRGEVKDLPQGATPVDFAYAVHTDIGHRAKIAKVNGRVVPLVWEESEESKYALKNGDVVEILMKKEPAPNQYWLHFVKTSSARTKIISWFRNQDRDRNIRAGRELLNQQLEKLGKPFLSPNADLLKNYGGGKHSLKEREDILEAIGTGAKTVSFVLKKLFSSEELLASKRKTLKEEREYFRQRQKEIIHDDWSIIVDGQSNIPVNIARCCQPAPGDAIIGYITRGRGITIHKKQCRVLNSIDMQRVKDVSWADDACGGEPYYTVQLRLRVLERVGLLRDITNVIADMGINIVNVSIGGRKPDQSFHFIKLVLQIANYDQLDTLMYRLQNNVDGVEGVRKV